MAHFTTPFSTPRYSTPLSTRYTPSSATTPAYRGLSDGELFSPLQTAPSSPKVEPTSPRSPVLSELQALSSTAARDEFFEEAKLRDLLVQRRITREGLTWQALPYAIQRELDSVRELYAAAAAAGHVEASYNLGLMYYLGKGVGRNLERAVELLQRAAANGHAEASYLMAHSEAQFNLALLYLAGGRSSSVPKDPARAAELLAAASAQGHVEATYRLGRMLFVGEELPRDHQRSLVLLQRAADAGKAEAHILIKSPKSQFALGLLFEEGHPGLGVAQSYVKALQCYRRAASSGHAEAQHRLGLLYQQGLGGPENPSLAVQSFQRSAHQGLAEAQHHLGLLYYHGQGVGRDLVRARGFWRRAADQKHPEALFSLGYLYFNGEGVAPDLSKAANLYGAAAAAGHGKAATTLAYMCYHGDGVPRDFWRASELAHAGAASGQPDAHFLLGVMHENGDGVVKDPVQATLCYRRAARLGHSEGEARLAITTALLHASSGPLVGERVVVHSMPLSSGFNGKSCLVLGYDAATGYCSVELPDGRTTKFRPENLAAPYN